MFGQGLDAIEEVTVSTATLGAESGGQVAIQIKFVTRSSSNDFHGSNGAYTFAYLMPGVYKVTVTATGFKQACVIVNDVNWI